MKSKLLPAMFLAFVISFVCLAGFAPAAEIPGPHGPVQDDTRPTSIQLKAKIPEVAKPYLEKMSVVNSLGFEKNGHAFFAIVAIMPRDDTSDVIGATSVYCYSTEEGPDSVKIVLTDVVGIYISKINPSDPKKPKIDRIYYDDSVPCMEKFRKKEVK